MKRKHEKEIIRWAKSPDGTAVWFRGKSSTCGWRILSEPHWGDDVLYVVDDEYAEVRKAIADGKTIQTQNTIDGNWFDVTPPQRLAFNLPAGVYRIKPKEPTYEWQWLYNISGSSRLALSSCFATEQEVKNWSLQGLRKLEETKKERKCATS